MADYSAGQAYLTILPSLTGFGDRVREQLKKEFSDPIEAPVKPTIPPEDSPEKKGDEWGGAFGSAARKRIEAALAALPKVKIDADSDEADRKIDELRTRLEELRGKRLGIDISGAEAITELEAIHRQLDEIGRNHPDVTVRANTSAAMAEIAALNREVNDLDGKRARFNVDDGGSAQSGIGNLGALATAGIALGPAIIPVAAAVAAALGAIGTGAVVGIAALASIKLATAGIGGAISALDAVQNQQGQNALQLHAQQVASANSVASAQDGVRSAITAVTDAVRAEGIANAHAAEQVQNAQRGVDDAYRSTALSIQSAISTEAQAEQTLDNALQSEKVAQDALTLSRQTAQRQIESLTLSVEDGALAERQATLSIESAKQALDKTLANPTATQLQRDQAQLTYDQAVQQLKDIQSRNKNLQQDQQAAVKAGVDGSLQVQSAQRGVTAATQAVANAQRGVATATAAVTEARRAGDEKIMVAEQGLRDAQAAQIETARSGAESVAKAQQGVIAAQRSLEGALASAAASAQQNSAANQKLAQSMKDLSPAGQEFARFIYGLKPELLDLQHVAQQGLLPGVEQGIKNVMPLFPTIKGLIGDVSTEIGNMAARTGAALTNPFWTGFFGFIRQEATPTLHTFFTVMGNVATGGAAILEAFKPVWDQMGRGITSWSEKFSAAAQNLQSNPQFINFMNYVKTEGPKVVQFIGDLGVTLIRLGEDLAPLGGFTLQLVDGLLHIVEWLEKANPLVLSWATGLASAGLLVAKLAPSLASAALSGGVFLEKLGLSAGASTTFANAGEKVSGVLGKVGKALPFVGIAVVALDAIWANAVTSTDDAAAAFLRGGAAAEQMRAKLDDELTWFGKWANGFLHFAATSDDATAAMNKQRAAMDPLTRAQSDATRAQNDYLNAVNKGGPTSAAAVEASGRFATATAEVSRQQDIEKRGLESTTDALKRQQEQILGALDADIAYENALQRTTDAITQNGKATDIHTVAGRNNLQAFLDLIRATQADEDEMRKNGASIDDLNAKHAQHIQQLQNVASNMGLTDAEAHRYIDTLGTVPKSVNTDFLANTIPGVAAVNQMATDIGNALRGIQDENVTVAFTGPGSVAGQVQGLAGAIPKATGGAIEGPGTGTSDSILARLSTGEHVWTAAETTAAGGHQAVTGLRALAMQKQLPAYAIGGPVNWSETGTFNVGGIPDLIARNLAYVRQAASLMKQKATADAAATYGSTGSLASAPGTEQWRGVGLQALAISGQSAGNIGKLLMQMGTESGGRTNAINRNDINWQHGTPSVGLMQVIGPTYARYHDPAHDVGPYEYGVAEDPLSNILSSIRYTLAAYGSLASGWQGHGYDSGGILPPGMTMAHNGTGANEHVLTGPQFSNLTNAAADGAGGGRPIVINVHPRENHSEADIADMVSRRLAFTLQAAL